LSYGVSPHRFRRRRRIRLAVILLVAAGALAAIVRYREPIAAPAVRVWRQHRALAASPQRNRAIYREVNVSADSIAFDGDAVDGWTQFAQVCGFGFRPIVFVGERRSAAGPPGGKQVVFIGKVGSYTDDARTPDEMRLRPLAAQAFTAPSLFSPAAPVAPPSFAPLAFPKMQLTRIFAGHADPSDPTRVVIPYQCNEQSGEIDALLQADGTVAFRVRSGPAKVITPGRVRPL